MATPLPPSLAFYTVFCGKDQNIANRVPPRPSLQHDCYFYTNNAPTGEKARAQGWIVKTLEAVSEGDPLKDCMDAKHVKVCPHLYPDLGRYEYTCFSDSKTRVAMDMVLKIIASSTKPFMVCKHPYIFTPNIEEEYDESMKQPRYVRQHKQYRRYIEKQLVLGRAQVTEHHLCCTIVIRKMTDPQVAQLNEAWWQHIQECGIQDQLSFFFVKQLYPELIQAIDERPYIYWS
jgi:hypothetical protein